MKFSYSAKPNLRTVRVSINRRKNRHIMNKVNNRISDNNNLWKLLHTNEITITMTTIML